MFVVKNKVAIVTLALSLLVFTLPLSFAQDLEVPFRPIQSDGQAADCPASFVAGLKADGDGFLAVRTGPGSEYSKIGELYNGDVVIICDTRGKWVGVFYGRVSVNNPSSLDGEWDMPFKGWIHSNWLRPLAG